MGEYLTLDQCTVFLSLHSKHLGHFRAFGFRKWPRCSDCYHYSRKGLLLPDSNPRQSDTQPASDWGTHCRSDQLDHPDLLNFPIKPDQAGLKGVYTTSSRPLLHYRRSIIPTYTRALHELNLTNWTSARSPPDLYPTWSGCDQILLE